MLQYRLYDGKAIPSGLQGFLKASANIGSVVGQFSFGYAADYFGRKAVCTCSCDLPLGAPRSLCSYAPVCRRKGTHAHHLCHHILHRRPNRYVLPALCTQCDVVLEVSAASVLLSAKEAYVCRSNLHDQFRVWTLAYMHAIVQTITSLWQPISPSASWRLGTGLLHAESMALEPCSIVRGPIDSRAPRASRDPASSYT